MQQRVADCLEQVREHVVEIYSAAGPGTVVAKRNGACMVFAESPAASCSHVSCIACCCHADLPKRRYGSVLCWVESTQHAFPAVQDEVAHAGLL